MRICENVEMLELPGREACIYPVLTWDEEDAVLIDTGYPGQFDKLKATIEKTGLTVDRITKVILTHQDVDHIGCAKLFKELGADVLAHLDEAPYISGEKKPVKLAGFESRINQLSEEEKGFYNMLNTAYKSIFVTTDKTLEDGELIPCCGGIEILHTPGHTPGHIAVLLKKANILVAGDGANIENGGLTGANPKFTKDMGQALESFERIKAVCWDAILCYHGGLYHQNIKQF